MTVPTFTPIGAIAVKAVELAVDKAAIMPSVATDALREGLMRGATGSEMGAFAATEGSIPRALTSLDKLIIDGPNPTASSLLRDTAKEHAEGVAQAADSERERQNSDRQHRPQNQDSADPGGNPNHHRRRRSTLTPF